MHSIMAVPRSQIFLLFLFFSITAFQRKKNHENSFRMMFAIRSLGSKCALLVFHFQQSCQWQEMCSQLSLSEDSSHSREHSSEDSFVAPSQEPDIFNVGGCCWFSTFGVAFNSPHENLLSFMMMMMIMMIVECTHPLALHVFPCTYSPFPPTLTSPLLCPLTAPNR